MVTAQDYLKQKHKLADFERAVVLGDLQSIYSMMEDFADEANSSNDIQNVSVPFCECNCQGSESNCSNER